MKSSAKISVVIPVFQVSPYIDRCMESVCNQTEQDIEIICVYTESKDGTFNKLKTWADRDARIQIVQRDDGGLGGARNTGMAYARGQYIAFVDSDDWLEPTMLQDLLKMAERCCADVVICPFRSFDDARQEFVEDAWGGRLFFPDELQGKMFTLADLPPELYVSPNAPVTAWNKLYRRDFLRKAQLTFPENCRYEDNPFYYEMMTTAHLSFVQKPYYNYRVNRKGSLQASSAMDESVFDIIKVMKSISEMLERQKIGEVYQQAFHKYMLSEFAWRFQTLRGNKRRFLQAISAAMGDSVYDGLLSLLRSWGEDINSELFHRIPTEIPQVSVIIPVYNNARDIAQCLDSVLAQADIRLEIYCVDDCSTDLTAHILEEYRAKDRRVHVLQKSKNTGAGQSRELALHQVSGEFIFFLDGDDLLPKPDVLAHMYATCKRNKELTCAGNMHCFYDDDLSQVFPYSGSQISEPGKHTYGNYYPHPSWGFTRFLYNLEVILEHDIHFPEWRYYEDPLFFVRYMTAEQQYCTITDSVYLYRQKPGSGETFTDSKFFDLYASLKIIFPLLDTVNKQVYYEEYHTFLHFCDHLFHYLEAHPESGEALISGADEVFQMIDFSAYTQLFPSDDMICSYTQFLNARHPETIRPKEDTQTVQPEKTQEKKPGLLRRLLKKLLKPFYQPFRHRYEDPLGEALEAVRTIQRQNDELLQRQQNNVVGLQKQIQEEGVNVQQRIQEDAVNIQQQVHESVANVQQQVQEIHIALQLQQKITAELQQQAKQVITLVSEQQEVIAGLSQRLEDVSKLQQQNIQANTELKQDMGLLQKQICHKLDLLEISVNGQQKWDAKQIQKRLFNLQFMCEKYFGKEDDIGQTSSIYGSEFYDDNRYESVISGVEVFRLLIPILQSRSILDLGCGTGTWLYAAKKFGVKDVHGVDGDYVNRNSLMIKLEEFEPVDLSGGYSANRRYDLTISLEVAEHLDEKYVDAFVETLCGASDVLLFSAAHPGQGGDGHLNEQPLEYWKDKIEHWSFRYIEIRPLFKENQNITWWYRDNIALFVRGEHMYTTIKEKIQHLIG